MQRNKLKNYIIRISIYVFGLVLSSFGIALALKSQLGVSAWDAVFAALGRITPFTIGTWSIAIQFTFWSITALINKKAQVTCIVPIVIRGISLDCAKYFISFLSIEITTLNSYVLFLSGYVLVAIGIGVYVSVGFPRLPIDSLMIAISKLLSWSINKSRFLIESTGFITAMILKGDIGIGTIIITLSIAPLITIVQKIIKQVLEKAGITSWK